MDQQEQKSSGGVHLMVAVMSILVAAACYFVSEDLKGSWEYYLDGDTHNAVKAITSIGWGAVIFAVIEGFQALIKLTIAESIPDNVNLTTCPDCGKRVSKHAEMCPCCGRRSPAQAKMEIEEKQTELGKVRVTREEITELMRKENLTFGEAELKLRRQYSAKIMKN